MNITTARQPVHFKATSQAARTAETDDLEEHDVEKLSFLDRLETGATVGALGTIPLLGIYQHSRNSWEQPNIARALLVGYGGTAINLFGSVALLAGIASGNLETTQVGVGLLAASGLTAGIFATA